MLDITLDYSNVEREIRTIAFGYSKSAHEPGNNESRIQDLFSTLFMATTAICVIPNTRKLYPRKKRFLIFSTSSELLKHL